MRNRKLRVAIICILLAAALAFGVMGVLESRIDRVDEVAALSSEQFWFEASTRLVSRGVWLPEDISLSGVLDGDTALQILSQEYLSDADDISLEGATREALVDTLEFEGYILPNEAVHLRNNDVNWMMVWHISLVWSENWPMPSFCYPDVAPQDVCTGIYADSRAAAVAMGLISETCRGDQRIRVGDFLVYLDELLTLEYDGMSVFMDSLPYSELVNFELSSTHPKMYRAWNAYFKGVVNLPVEWLTQFYDQGWCVVMAPVYEDREEPYAIKGGLTAYAAKRIYLNKTSEEGLYHEFGHYIAGTMGYSPMLQSIFDAESEAMRPYFRDYAFTSASEYFADCVACWFYIEDGPKILRECSPMAYDLILDALA